VGEQGEGSFFQREIRGVIAESGKPPQRGSGEDREESESVPQRRSGSDSGKSPLVSAPLPIRGASFRRCSIVRTH
jgi:hypothetical protein